MSVAELLAELPRLTSQERRQIVDAAKAIEQEEQAKAGPRLWYCKETGKLVGRPGDVILQSEIDAILADFP
jgi:hypothetical protein